MEHGQQQPHEAMGPQAAADVQTRYSLSTHLVDDKVVGKVVGKVEH